MRRTRFVVRHLEVVAPLCCGFRGVFGVRRDLVLRVCLIELRTHTTCCKYLAALSYLFERSEFLIATCKKKITDRLSVRLSGVSG